MQSIKWNSIKGLVVDDECTIRDMAASALSDAGYPVLAARDGTEALRLARSCAGGLDFLVTDYEIGTPNGLEIASAIRSMFPRIRVVLMSGSAVEPAAGVVNAFLPKPFLTARLCAEVRHLLEAVPGSGNMHHRAPARSPEPDPAGAPKTNPANPAVLYAGPAGPDRDFLRDLFRNVGWTLQTASDIQEVSMRVRAGDLPLVITERDLPDGNWYDLLERVSNLASPPYVIVSSRLADARLWAEVLNLGGFDLLATPFAAREVLHVVTHAWQSWHVRFTGVPRRCLPPLSLAKTA